MEIIFPDFKKVKTLSESDDYGNVVKSYELTYGVDEQRRKSVYTEAGNTTTFYYLGDYEEEVKPNGNIRKIHYLHGGGILIHENGQESLFYGYTDHLGSLTALTDQSGNVTERYAYDPWGNRRDPYYWANADNRSLLRLNRGFTMHEHIDQFGIINMNGRVYDPLTSQSFSPDPYVQAPEMWLNYNRYAYCLNNPLIYTDPTGEYAVVDDIIAAVLGGTINLIVNAFQGNVHNFGQGVSLFFVGAAGTWAGLYCGPVVSGMIIGGGNSFVNQGFGNDGNWNSSNISGGDVVMGIAMGGITSYASISLSNMITPYASSLTSNLGGQAVQQALTQGITGSATGFVINTGFALGSGADWNTALQEGGRGALMGFGIKRNCLRSGKWDEECNMLF